ncbi:phage Gp37/Gp68 family protein [Methylocapsa aurea]|uniref:phage Gp37/Gp68 family protein n=1 Tax=Methylocapsa aurea TaxID=663610 RepID=UPI00055FE5BC|nr:phage Gp37/Gp68 family protein [Methylocapsa aurea]
MHLDVAIAWTDATWDPLAGCTRKSAACRHCYAEAMTAAASQAGMWGHGFAELGPAGPAWTGKIELLEDRLALPLGWDRPSRIFVNAGSDLFHESLPNAAIDRVFAVMALAPHLTFQVLTKRPKTMLAYLLDSEALSRIERAMGEIATDPNLTKIDSWPLPNVWLGVTAENQKEADRRIPLLLQTPAAVRWIAAEPLLEQLDLKVGTWLKEGPNAPGPKLDWIVAGGEIGAEALPCQPNWARSLRDQCAESGAAFFWHQWGEHVPCAGVEADPAPEPVKMTFSRVGAAPSPRLLDGALHQAFPFARS